MIDGQANLRTLANRNLRREERETFEETLDASAYERPRTRGDCRDQPRPCPWVSCVHHLYLDVNEESGALTLNFPHLEVWEMPNTCSLDIADRGGRTLEGVGEIVNLTRERIRQVEVVALAKVKEAAEGADWLPPEHPNQD